MIGLAANQSTHLLNECGGRLDTHQCRQAAPVLSSEEAMGEGKMMEIAPAVVVQVILLAREGASAEAQLAGFIAGLAEDEKAELTAVAWVGRGAFEAEEFDEAVATALAEATVPTEDYLMGMPHLAENLEAGLEALGVDVTGEEEDLL